MASVFVSFDYDNDKAYKFLIEAWDSNPNFTFTFDDRSSKKIDSNNVGVVKRVLSQKISSATHTLVIVGKYANEQHRDHELIGYKNWINYEVAKSKELGNKLVAVKLQNEYSFPDELLGAGASLAKVFKEDPILRAVNAA